MTHTIAIDGLGARTPVVVDGPAEDAFASAIRHAWSRCLDGPVPDVTTDPVTVDADTPDGVDGALQPLTQEITRAKIKAQTGRLLMLHASGLAQPETGDALAFVAPGGTGKTTLARTLGTRFGYLTDETMGITPEGLILPYQKPLSIRLQPNRSIKGETSPDDLGLLPAPATPRLRRIVLLARSDRHEGDVTVEELPLADTLIGIAPESSALSALPRPLHLAADIIEPLDPTIRLGYREVDDVLDLVASWLEPR